MKVKVLIAAIILLPVLAHLIFAVAASPAANYYITADEYAARSSTLPVRIGGQIVPGSLRWDNVTQTMRFQIAGSSTTIAALYRGRVPDVFRDGGTAILEGARAADGTFVATSVTIRCPHQYLPEGW
jgi:cytochrome c-type biogenesis protein CcmE